MKWDYDWLRKEIADEKIQHVTYRVLVCISFPSLHSDLAKWWLAFPSPNQWLGRQVRSETIRIVLFLGSQMTANTQGEAITIGMQLKGSMAYT